MELRSYSKAKEIYENDQKEPDSSKRQTGPLIDLVQKIEFEFAAEAIAAKKEPKPHD